MITTRWFLFNIRVAIYVYRVFTLDLSLHFFFFFSSRRRHTRWPRDWSSDVCSSDLTTNSILDLLVDINEKLGLTIILITHEMHVIRKICNRVAVMEDGKVVEHGDVLDVFLKPKELVTKKCVERVMGLSDENDGVHHCMLSSDIGQ